MSWRRLAMRLAIGGAGLAGVAVLAGATVCLTSGCSTLGYYAQSVSGHVALMRSARPVDDWLADPATPPALRDRLVLAQKIRRYAVTELALPDNASYTRYADIGRPAAVWNVVAAPELSLTLDTWCFVVVGCVGYRGYYDRAEADAQAAALRARHKDVNVYGVPAYSTLGWMNWAGGDPLLSTFIRNNEIDLARLVFHELAHQVAYAAGDTVFNESFAVSVERLGSARWMASEADAATRSDFAAIEARRADFRRLTQGTRDALDALYRGPVTDDEKRRRKAELLEALRSDYAALKAGAWGGFAGYDGWFARANNASFGVLAAYNDLVPEFTRLFEREGSDFKRFYAEVRRLARLPKDERRAALTASP